MKGIVEIVKGNRGGRKGQRKKKGGKKVGKGRRRQKGERCNQIIL